MLSQTYPFGKSFDPFECPYAKEKKMRKKIIKVTYKKNYWKQKLINFQNGFFFVNDHLVINMKP